MVDIKKIKPRFITDEEGNKVEVILPINVFNSLIEDIQDLAVRAERIDEATVTHQELLEGLKADGLI